MSDLFFFCVVLLSAVFHEYMHGWAAYQMGDTTAKDMGRLTLNPLVHIDPVFTILLPLTLYLSTGGRFMFAAAKPVPFNPYNLRYQKYGPALVGIAGPTGNLIIAALFGGIFQFLPLSPLMASLVVIVVQANVMLAVFNLVPIPPLDGSHVLLSLIPPRYEAVSEFLQQYGIILFFVFLFFFVDLILPLVNVLTKFFLGIASTSF